MSFLQVLEGGLRFVVLLLVVMSSESFAQLKFDLNIEVLSKKNELLCRGSEAVEIEPSFYKKTN